MAKRQIITASEGRAAVAQIADAIDEPIGVPRVTAGPENGSSTRRITIQVRDRLGQPRGGERWKVHVYFTATAGGPPVNTQTVTLVTGRIIQTIAANQEYVLATDTDGKIELDVTVAGSATRYLECETGGRFERSPALAWV